MNRTIVYPAQIPLDTDVLHAFQDTLIAVGAILQMALGLSTWVSGLACTPVASTLTVSLATGSIITNSEVDPNAYGSLGIDTDQLVKQAHLTEPTVLTFVPPTTTGFSQCFLIQGQFQETDANPLVLPFYNPGNPTQAFAGPGNSGATSNTRRVENFILEIKPGTAVATGSQTAPTPDAGWSPLYVITLANGATSIVSGNIAVAANAPFIPGGSLVAYITQVLNAVNPPVAMAYAGGAGGPITTSEIVLQEPVLGPLSFSLNFGGTGTFRGAVGYMSVAPTAAMVFNILQNTTVVGTMNFAAGSNFATFAASPAPAFVRNDILLVTAPITADATAANLSFTLWGQM